MRVKITANLLFILLTILTSLKSYGQRDTTRFAGYGVRSSGSYNKQEKQSFPSFSYQGPEDVHLSYLRTCYHLDSVAGKGSETDRVLHLLEWFHNLVPHNDGENIDTLTAVNIIKKYQTVKAPQGCYPLSIAMNEILLSMGFRSRSVICFSNKFPVPNGGHVVNAVYIDSLHKWIYIDPQENAFIKDEQGNFLSVAEVRERLINGKPMVLNPAANYHHVPSKKEDYIYRFLAEHLYRIICPVGSEWNSQTKSPGKNIEYIELLPYKNIEPTIGGFETHQADNYRVITFHTHNDELFWQAPPKQDDRIDNQEYRK